MLIMDTLLRLFTKAINTMSAENNSNTPDFILAEFLVDVLTAFDKAVQKRETWHKGGVLLGEPELRPCKPALDYETFLNTQTQAAAQILSMPASASGVPGEIQELFNQPHHSNLEPAMPESSAEIIAIIKDHAEFCKTTFAWWEGEHQNEMNMTHTVIGIVGELAELDLSDDVDNYTEELGDIFYYLCMLHALTDEVPIDIDLGFRDTSEVIDIYITALKKMVFYKHNVQPDVKYILGWMHNQMNWRNITFKSIAAANKAKLQRRYASGSFSSQEAADRADKN